MWVLLPPRAGPVILMVDDVAIIPNRWAGHRVDVCMVIRDGQVSFVARDVLEAIGFPPEGEFAKDPGHSGGRLDLHAQSITWTREHLATVLEPSSMVMPADPLHVKFLAWIDKLLGDVDLLGVERIRSLATRVVATRDMTVASPAAATWYSVEDAAKLLSTDEERPRLTRPALFSVLEQRGWIYREDNIWFPQRDFLLAGLLVVNDVRIPQADHLYPQICITPLGLRKLHSWLGYTTPLALPTPIRETLP